MAGSGVLSADAICAFTWGRADERTREGLCSLAGVPRLAAILNWFEIEPADQTKLRAEIADLIHASGDRQRAAWRKQAERMAKGAA